MDPMTKEEAIALNKSFLSLKSDKKSLPGNESLWATSVCGVCGNRFLEFEKFLDFIPLALRDKLINNSRKVHTKHLSDKDKEYFSEVAYTAKREVEVPWQDNLLYY